MEKQIALIIFGILLIGIISAQVSISPNYLTINAYPGETHPYNFSVSSDGTYTLLLNSSNQFITISPSELIVNNGENIILNITFSKNTPLGEISFSIGVLVGIEQNEVVEQHYSGSSCRYNKNYDWNCSDWSECINLKQTRVCRKYNNCRTTYGKPNEIIDCIETQIDDFDEDDFKKEEEETEEKDKFNWVPVIIGVGLALFFFLLIILLKKLRKKDERDLRKKRGN